MSMWMLLRCIVLLLAVSVLATARRDSRRQLIVGGSKADKQEFPYFVQGAGCGATLIWNDIILSAAHCYNFLEDKTDRTVIVGAYKSQKQNRGNQRSRISLKVLHQQYVGNNGHDLLIAKLHRPVTKKRLRRNSIQLAETQLPLGSLLTAIGFGQLKGGGRPDQLHKVETLRITDTQDCRKLIRKQGGLTIQTEAALCAAADAPKQDTCQGDSGGPLIFNATGEPVLVGVTSLGIGCGITNNAGTKVIPSVYTSVAATYDWIWQHICWMSSNPPKGKCRKLLAASSSNRTTVRIDLQSDGFPHEISYQIYEIIPQQSTDSTTANLVFHYRLSRYFNRPRIKSTRFFDDLKPATQYILQVLDSIGDGVPGGHVRIKYVNAVTLKRTALLHHDFDFTNVTRVAFETPAAV